MTTPTPTPTPKTEHQAGGHSYVAAVRFQDGRKLKFHVEDVPDCVDAVRKLIHDEVHATYRERPRSIVIALQGGVAAAAPADDNRGSAA